MSGGSEQRQAEHPAAAGDTSGLSQRLLLGGPATRNGSAKPNGTAEQMPAAAFRLAEGIEADAARAQPQAIVLRRGAVAWSPWSLSGGHCVSLQRLDAVEAHSEAVTGGGGRADTANASKGAEASRDALPADAKSHVEALLPMLQASMDRLIERAIGTVVQSVEGQKLDGACPANALPADRSLWGTGWVRVVRVGGLGCPCGGTHVRSTAELGAVKVEGIKTKGKVTRVSYSMHDA